MALRRPSDHADDVVQDVWLTAVRRIGRFDPVQGSFAGWLRGIAANLLRNHFRRGRRDRTRPLNDEHPSVGTDDTALRERAERIASALAALPERYEAGLRAKYLDGAFRGRHCRGRRRDAQGR